MATIFFRSLLVTMTLTLLSCSDSSLGLGESDLDRRMLSAGEWSTRKAPATFIWPRARFSGDTALFHCPMCDTAGIYFRYEISGNAVVFRSLIDSSIITRDVVELLTDDTLKFRTLLYNAAPHTFTR